MSHSLLLDTHILLWWLADDPALAPIAREAIIHPEHRVLVSAATAWEIAIKRALGKLDAPRDLEGVLDDGGLETLAITVSHALAAGELPGHHQDPFDRMLIAQARLEGLTVVSVDPRFHLYDVALFPT